MTCIESRYEIPVTHTLEISQALTDIERVPLKECLDLLHLQVFNRLLITRVYAHLS